mmetsp:Transcript_21205/g.59652  ORF Transcript_21205/g.59652 Transcript_21205/m.59652 type:complete len:255 (+) Transcript_21205:98-862(+)
MPPARQSASGWDPVRPNRGASRAGAEEAALNGTVTCEGSRPTPRLRRRGRRRQGSRGRVDGDLPDLLDVRVVARQLLAPPVEDLVAPDHERAAESDHPLRDLPELDPALRDGGQLPRAGQEVPGRLEAALGLRHPDSLQGLQGDVPVLLVDAADAGGVVRGEAVAVHEGLVPGHVRVLLQEGAELLAVADGDEERPDNPVPPASLLPELTPGLGVAPAETSSEVPQKHDDRSPLSHLLAQRDQFSIGVGEHGRA